MVNLSGRLRGWVVCGAKLPDLEPSAITEPVPTLKSSSPAKARASRPTSERLTFRPEPPASSIRI